MSNESVFDVVQKLQNADFDFSEIVQEFGLEQGFEMDSRLIAPRDIRPLFYMSLLPFRRVYFLRQTKGAKGANGELNFVPLSQIDDPQAHKIKVEIGYEFSMNELATELIQIGYSRVATITSSGDFSIIGGILNVWIPDIGYNNYLSIDFFGDNIDSISIIDYQTKNTLENLDSTVIEAYISALSSSRQNSNKFETEVLNKASDKVTSTTETLLTGGNPIVFIEDSETFDESLNEEFIQIVTELKEHDITTISITAIGSKQDPLLTYRPTHKLRYLKEKLEETESGQNLWGILTGAFIRHGVKNKVPQREKIKIDQLSIGDYLVHDIHGIGKFAGIETREARNFDSGSSKFSQTSAQNSGQNSDHVSTQNSVPVLQDYIVIEYASSTRKIDAPSDFLYVPLDEPESLAPYIGSDKPRLSRFGGADFAKRLAKAKKYTKDIAAELVKIYSSRLATEGIKFDDDSDQMWQFEQGFEFELTPDQAKAIEAVKSDMESTHPMDRLICGDVGFGKTEIALRAAFKAVLTGKQVAILVPTTILASQHFDTFKKRMENFPVRIAELSRFVSASDKGKIIDDLGKGKIDIVIGTHSLLTPKLVFKELGLIIVDEEQRFGAMHKEIIKKANLKIDVLSMSATPIPRTLEMALTGIRDVSMLQTPPVNRKSIITNVLSYSDELMKEAIDFEIARGGQVFLVHNNVSTLSSVATRVSELCPEAIVAIAHGQMKESRIDRVINDFWQKRIDVLVCTTIIETGIDISNANTLIIHKAERFGLSQLHQLRGRVGRSSTQSYAYMFFSAGKALTEQAYKRLETIQNLDELGAGTAIALKDLELRGAGDFLGSEQSGYIAGVGYDMYIRLMSLAIEKAKG